MKQNFEFVVRRLSAVCRAKARYYKPILIPPLVIMGNSLVGHFSLLPGRAKVHGTFATD